MIKTPAIIITYPFPLGKKNGGARMTREIALYIGRQNIPVYVIAVSFNHGDSFPRSAVDEAFLGYEFDEEFNAANVQVIRVKPSIYHNFLDGLGVRRALLEILDKEPVAAVLSYYSESIFLPRLLKARDVPFCLIATWQSYERVLKLPGIFRKPHKFLPAFIKRQMILKTYRQAQLLFASSDHTGKELSHFFNVRPERITTCYLGVSPEFARLPRPKPEQIKRFLFFGRLSESKGILDAIQAFGKLSALGYQDWRFDLYGDGDQNWIRSIIEAEGLEQQIAVHASLPDRALKNALVDAHLVILPSHIEAFGLAFAESQAAGLPVIAYKAGSVPEVVAHGQTGWLAPLGDTDGLAAYLRQAIDNPDQAFQMGLAGRERVKQLFTWEKTGDKILNGLKKLDKEPRS